MGFNIYEDAVTQTVDIPSKFKASDVKAEAETIFYQHAHGDVLFPGTAFNNVCMSLARAYPDTIFAGLSAPHMIGRAWSLFDTKAEGGMRYEEFIEGVDALLNPQTPAMVAFVNRLKAGRLGPMPRSRAEYSAIQKVGIVGGGVAGLQVARQLTEAGKTCVIFEKSKDIGGVWRENYADFGLQVPRELYEFPGFPWPKDREWDEFPKGADVQLYIQLYAKEYNLYEICKFETSVLEINAIAGEKTGWTIKSQKKGSLTKDEDFFDFVVIATGMYSSPPHMPKAKGHKKFQGEIHHSCSFLDKAQAKDKKVVVVGGGKSAVDNAVAAAKTGKSSMLLTRTPHWPVPRKLCNLVPFKFGTYSRFGHFMLPTFHDEGSLSAWLHGICKPLKWGWWRIVETMFKIQFNLPKELIPKEPMESDLFTGGQILNYEFRDMLEKGEVKCKIGAIDYFKENSVVLCDGTEVEADLVIYGTGFKKSYDIFDSTFVQPKLGIEDDGLYLYRNIIPPNVPNLAFVGSEVSTFNNVLTHGLQAVWLRRLLTGELALPGQGGMTKVIEKEKAWKRSWMPASSARASIWQLHMTKYHDMLMKDLGESHRRKCNPLSEALMPYQARDYAKLFNNNGTTDVTLKSRTGVVTHRNLLFFVFIIFFLFFFFIQARTIETPLQLFFS